MTLMKSNKVVLKAIGEAVLGFCVFCLLLPIILIVCLVRILDEVSRVVTGREPWKTSLARDWVLGKRPDHVEYFPHW